MNEKTVVENDVDKYSSLESLSVSKGGVLLMEGLKSDIVDSINRLIGGYRTLPHMELIAIIASLDIKYNMHRAISKSGENKKLAKNALEEILTAENN